MQPNYGYIKICEAIRRGITMSISQNELRKYEGNGKLHFSTRRKHRL